MNSLQRWRTDRVVLGKAAADVVARKGGKGPSRITLVFQARRVGNVRGGRKVAGWTWKRPTHDVPNAIALERGDGAPAVPPAVEVWSEGDPLRLARVILDYASGPIAVEPDRKVDPALPPSESEKTTPFGTPEYLRAMHEAFEKLPKSAITRYRTFFFELDRRTEADLMKSAGLITTADGQRIATAMAFVRRALDARMEAHMRAFCVRPISPATFHDPLSFREHVETISDVFLRLLWEFFPDGVGGIDVDAFEEAFEMFATGELRFWLAKQNTFTTEPSSGAFFLFGQFALLAAECDVLPELWTRLANVMVRTQRLYCTAYPADTSDVSDHSAGRAKPAQQRPARLADYKAKCYEQHQRPTSRERAALRAQYSGLSLGQLSLAAIRNLAELAPGEWEVLGLPLMLAGMSPPPPSASAGQSSTGLSSSSNGSPSRASTVRRSSLPIKQLKPLAPKSSKSAKRASKAAKQAKKHPARRGRRRSSGR